MHAQRGEERRTFRGAAVSALVFANNVLSAAQIEALLATVLQKPGERCWALLDGALLDVERASAFVAVRQSRVYNTLATSSFAGFGNHAPQLLALPEDPVALGTEVRSIMRLAGKATAVSWISSPAPAETLQTLFAYLAKATVEARNAPIHCRFADTRVLPELLRALRESQRARVASLVSQWHWTGRTGHVSSWIGEVMPDDTAQVDSEPNLRLSIAQFRQMQRAAEADGIFMMLCDRTPELVPSANLGEFHEQLCRQLSTADGLQVRLPKDRLEFVVLSLSCGEDFHQSPALRPDWAAIADQEASLFDLMQSWDDAIWSQLESHTGALNG